MPPGDAPLVPKADIYYAAKQAPLAVERFFGICLIALRRGVRNCCRALLPAPVWHWLGKRLPKSDRLTVAKAFFFIWSASRAAYVPYTSLFFTSQGLTAGEVGAIAAARPFVSIVGTPLWSMVADRTGMHRTILISSLVISATLLVMMGLVDMTYVTPWATAYFFYMSMASLSDFLGSPAGPLVDNSVFELLGDEGHRYGEVRLFAGIGYGAAAFGAGYVVQAFGDLKVVWYLLAIMTVPTILLVLRFRVSTPHAVIEHEEAKAARKLSNADAAAAVVAPPVVETATVTAAATGVDSAAALAALTPAPADSLTPTPKAEDGRPAESPEGRPHALSGTGHDLAATTTTTDAPGNTSATEAGPKEVTQGGSITPATTPSNSPRLNPHPNTENAFTTALHIIFLSPAVFGVFLIGFSQGVGLGFIGSFESLRIKELGGATSLVGVAVAIACAAEVLLMHLSPMLLRKFNAGALLSFSSLALVGRLVVVGLATETWHILLADLLHSFTWGVYWTTTLYMARGFAPEGLTTTTIALVTMTMGGIGVSVGNAVFGNVLAERGSETGFLATAAVVALSLVLYILIGLTKGWSVTAPPVEHPLGKTVEAAGTV